MKPLEIAQRIVRGTYDNVSHEFCFFEVSGIYKFTNECITAYFNHLQNKEELLSVISSGNHILNAILGGSRKIDGFDISIFPEYYLFLQLAAVLTLSKKEYFEYFLSDDREVVFSDEYYDRVREKLPCKYKEFWDGLYNFNDGFEIYDSYLFRTDLYMKNNVISNNPFLQEDNYEKLRRILQYENVRINTMVADIVHTKFDKEYDLILLSNILAYHFKIDEMDKYFAYLDSNFKLKENGELIDYDFTPARSEAKKSRLNARSSVEVTDKSKILVYRK